MMRAQTGAFDNINFQGMTETGSFATLPPKISFFSCGLSSGSSFGELYAWRKINKSSLKVQCHAVPLL
jgi:hypothetical protein